jgi:hypothetical protein
MMVGNGSTVDNATQLLATHDGRLRKAIEAMEAREASQ